MALVEQPKKGGRYTKKEQEVRKLQVYDLHFEQNKSAVEIAEILNVNRNTINDDIKYWRNQITSELDPQKTVSKLIKQIQRLEIQRDRLLEDLEFTEDIDDKIKLEKLIAQINDKLIHYHSKVILDKKENHKFEFEEINDDVIKEFVRDLILSDESPESEDEHSEDELKFDFIKRTKCDISHAESVIKKMKQDGLVLCELSRLAEKNFSQMFFSDISSKYNIARFANLRGYLTINEFTDIRKRRLQIKQEIESEEE